MTARTPRIRHESIEWAPRCPACGAAAEEATALGDDVAPRGASGLRGRTVACAECGAAIVIGPDTEWVPAQGAPRSEED